MGQPRGFTLLEVMVAFVIAALALAALTQGAAGGLRSTRIAAHEQEAVSRARSRMALLDVALRPGEQSGDDGGGFLWRVQVTPIAEGGPPRAGDPPRAGRPILYQALVTISWRLDGGERNVTLATERLGMAPLAPP